MVHRWLDNHNKRYFSGPRRTGSCARRRLPPTASTTARSSSPRIIAQRGAERARSARSPRPVAQRQRGESGSSVFVRNVGYSYCSRGAEDGTRPDRRLNAASSHRPVVSRDRVRGNTRARYRTPADTMCGQITTRRDTPVPISIVHTARHHVHIAVTIHSPCDRAKSTVAQSLARLGASLCSPSPARQARDARGTLESRVVQSSALLRQVEDRLPIRCRARLLKKSASVDDALLAGFIAFGANDWAHASQQQPKPQCEGRWCNGPPR